MSGAVRTLFAIALLFAVVDAAWAGEHPTIHHAGIVRSVEPATGVILVDETMRLGPPLVTRIHVTAETVVIRVGRTEAEFRGEPVPLDQLRDGDYVVVRGVDRGDRHLAEVIWSLGPAR